MTDYIDRLNAKRELFLQKVEELQSILQEMTDGRDFFAVESIRTFNFSIETCRREMQADMFDLDNKQEAYEDNLAGIGIVYFQHFGRASIALQNEDFLSWLDYNTEKKAAFVNRIKLIERDLLKGLLFNQEPISQKTINEYLSLSNEFKKDNCQGSFSQKFNTFYHSGFKWKVSAHQLYLINLANTYAHKNKNVPEAAEDIKEMFNEVEKEILKFNQFLWTNSPSADLSDLSASYYNTVLDQLGDLKKLGDNVLTKLGLSKEENLLQKFIPTARQTIMAADMAVYKGRFETTSKDIYTITYSKISAIHPIPGRITLIKDDGSKLDNCFLVVNKKENQSRTIQLNEHTGHVYSYDLPLANDSSINAVIYRKTEQLLNVPMMTCVYAHNFLDEPYIVYFSQLPTTAGINLEADYVCLSAMQGNPSILSLKPCANGASDIRLELPGNVSSVLIAELIYPNPLQPKELQTAVCTRVLHFLNKNRGMLSYQQAISAPQPLRRH